MQKLGADHNQTKTWPTHYCPKWLVFHTLEDLLNLLHGELIIPNT